MPLIRLLYRSESDLSGSPRAVRESAFAIAEASCVRNTADGVSGALMFIGGMFVQVLEGESTVVEAVFERICCDLRHRRIVLLDFAEVPERMFEDFGMVAFEGDARARELLPTVVDATAYARTNRLSAKTAIELMRSLLTKRQSRADPKAERLLATHVID